MILVCAMFALAQGPAFEVAAIRPVPEARSPGFSMQRLLTMAYRVKPYQLVAPDWIAAQRYAIQAKPPEGATSDQYPQMWLSLLTERFHLLAHRETRQLAVYALTVDKKGPRLKSAASTQDDADCASPPGGNLNCGNASMDDLVEFLNAIPTVGLDFPAVNRAGLTGRYSFDLKWRIARNPTGPEESIFDSLTNLGLRLDRQKIPMEVIIVDRLERTPTEN